MSENNTEQAVNRIVSLVNEEGCNVASLLDLLSEHRDITENLTLVAAVSIIKDKLMIMLNSIEELVEDDIRPAIG